MAPAEAVALAPFDRPADAQPIADLLARAMGTGWFAPSAIQGYVNPPGEEAAEPAARFGLLAREAASGALVGALLAEAVPPDRFAGTFLGTMADFADEPLVARLAGRTAGLISGIAVEERARGRGIATRLIEAGVEALRRRGAVRSYAFAWTSAARGCHLGGVLERVGFAPVRRLEEAYHDFSLRHDCRCPFCGQPCRCAAWLYVRLDDVE